METEDETDPETADVTDIVDRLVRGDRETRRRAFEVYTELESSRSIAATAAARLETHLTDDAGDVRRRAAMTAGVLVERDPEAFERVVPELRSIGDDPTEPGREPAVVALSKLGLERPTAVVPAIDTLLELCHDPISTAAERAVEPDVPGADPGRGGPLRRDREQRDRGRVHAIASLTRVAAEDPAALGGSVSSVGELLEDDNHLVRAAACEVLEALVSTVPEDVETFAPELAELAATGTKQPVPWRAADALVALAEERPEPVGDAVASIAAELSRFLDARNADRRRIGLTLLVEVARTEPAAIDPMVSTIRDRLEDDDAAVRSRAALVLGVARATGARDVLSDVAETDPDEAVRDAATRALEEIEHLEDERP